MNNKKQSPYGSWESVITPEKIIEGGLKFGEVRIDNKDIYFLEGRPSESGRSVILNTIQMVQQLMLYLVILIPGMQSMNMAEDLLLSEKKLYSSPIGKISLFIKFLKIK